MATRGTGPAGPTLVQIDVGEDEALAGDLTTVPGARGVVAFAHGAGAGRFDHADSTLARALEHDGFSTLLLDVGDVPGIATRATHLDLDRAATAIGGAVRWLARRPDTARLPIGLHGTGTGAAAVLQAASLDPDAVAAVVTRSGRPDLASAPLSRITAPTLLVVGTRDEVVLDHNIAALGTLSCERHLELVPEATHPFDDPRARGRADRATLHWYDTHLGSTA